MPYNTEIAFNQKKKELAKERSKPDEVGCSVLLAKENALLRSIIKEQRSSFIRKADELDKMEAETPQKTFHVDKHKRLAIEAGVYRACAHDLTNSMMMTFG